MYQEWFATQLDRYVSRSLSDLKLDMQGIASAAYRPQYDHSKELATIILRKVKLMIEEVGVATIKQVADSTHKKAVIYGMLHQSSDTTNALLRQPTSDLYQYLNAFIRSYNSYAGAAEQSLIRNGTFDTERGGDVNRLRILRLPKLDPVVRLRYGAKVNSHLKVLQVTMLEDAVCINLKRNLTFKDFFGIEGGAYETTMFTNDISALTQLAQGMFCVTVPFAEDLMCIAEMLKTIRRVQYERNH